MKCFGAEQIRNACQKLARNDPTLTKLSFGHAGAVAISEALAGNTRVKKVYLDWGGIRSVSAIAVANALQHHSSVEVLILRNYETDMEAIAALCAMLRVTTIKKLCLTSWHSVSKATVAIAKALRHNSSVEVLTLHGVTDVEAIAALCVTAIKITLDLSGRGIRSEDVIAIANILPSNSNVEKLDLSHNRIDIEMARALCAMIHSTAIKKLYLRNCQLVSEAIVAIANALQRNSSVDVLSLSQNRIDMDAAAALCAMIRVTIKKISLCGCEMRSEDVVAIANILRNNSRVEKLNLGMNRIDTKATEALSMMLGVNQKLHSFNFYGAGLNDCQVMVLARGLQNNTSLTRLNLARNKIGDDGVRTIVSALHRKEHLQSLNLDYNPFGTDGTGNLISHVASDMKIKSLFMEKEFIPEPPSIPFYLALNKAGRRLLREENVHPCLWAHMLAKVGVHNRFGPSMVHYFLRNKPDLCGFLARKRRSGRKRKRLDTLDQS